MVHKTREKAYCAKKQVTPKKKRAAQEFRILQLRCDNSNVYITAWSDQLKKINICIDTVATCSILRRDLVEPWSNLVINQQEQLLLWEATGESSTILRSVYMKLKLSALDIEWKFIVANIYDEWILGLDLIRKYGLIMDLMSFTWSYTITGSRDNCSPTSSQWGGFSTRAAETMQGKNVSWAGRKSKEDAVGLLWRVCTAWQWFEMYQFDLTPDQYWKSLTNQTGSKASFSGQMPY